MTRATWDAAEDRQWETGVDHGLFFPIDNNGVYGDGVPWNGLTNVTESPSGAEATPFYADNIKYAVLQSAEEFAATIEAFMCPREFEECDGTAEVAPGVTIGQQDRKQFGFYYRTIVGDANDSRKGYKHHFVYGCMAAPSERSHDTVNDSPELQTLSWELTTNPVEVGTIGGVEYKPTATLTVNSLYANADDLAELLDIVLGDDNNDPRMPLPSEVAAVMSGTATVVNVNLAANQPSFNNTTGVITLPNVTGIQWKVDGVNKAPGAQPALSVGESASVVATPQADYTIDGDPDWTFERV
jgi:hypothetical protein